MTEYLFNSVLITSALGIVLTFLLVVMRPVTKRRFSSSWHYYMWILVLVAMITPTRFSFGEKALYSYESKTPYNVSVHEAQVYIHGQTAVSQHTITSREESSRCVLEKMNFDIASKLWILIAVSVFLSKAVRYVFFSVKIRKHSHLSSCPMISLFTKRKIEVRKSTEIFSPLIMGFFKPVLLLPDISMTKEQTMNVLSHEMIHFKRGDVLYKWFALAVKSIHWFNPFVYYITSQLDTECEISCDMKVVENMTREEEMEYVNTILALVGAGNSKFVALTSSMTSNGKVLKRRFEMIKNKFKVNKKTVLISVLLAVLLFSTTVFASGFINGAFVDAPETKVESDAPETPEILPAQDEKELESFNEEKEVLDNKTPETPVYPCDGEISRAFSVTVEPSHVGIDIVAAKGTDVVSAISGTVVVVEYDVEKGNHIIVEKENLRITYAHLDSVCVSEGDNVLCGQIIGKVGSTGNSTGPHLHFEVTKDGEYINPEEFLN